MITDWHWVSISKSLTSFFVTWSKYRKKISKINCSQRVFKKKTDANQSDYNKYLLVVMCNFVYDFQSFTATTKNVNYWNKWYQNTTFSNRLSTSRFFSQYILSYLVKNNIGQPFFVRGAKNFFLFFTVHLKFLYLTKFKIKC